MEEEIIFKASRIYVMCISRKKFAIAHKISEKYNIYVWWGRTSEEIEKEFDERVKKMGKDELG